MDSNGVAPGDEGFVKKPSSQKKDDKNDGSKTTSTRDERSLSVLVKSEYVLTERSKSLPPLPPRPSPPAETSEEKSSNGKDNNNKKSNRFKKNRGMNHNRNKRSRNNYDNNGGKQKPCLPILRGEPCPFGDDNCNFNHNLKEMLANREPDIQEIHDNLGGCPIYNASGSCGMALTCRAGSAHTNLSTGEQICTADDKAKKESYKPIMNILSKDVQKLLRKKQYPFVCKRHFEKEDKGGKNKKDKNPATSGTKEVNDDNNSSAKEVQDKVEETTKTTKTSLPLLKERKLIDFSNRIYIAPLTTVGNLPFRRIMKHFGADITCGEMAVGTNLLEGKSSEWALLKRHPEEDIFGVQIACGYPDQITRVCELIENETCVDFVDVNMGCPLDVICDKGCGSALMLRDRKLKSMLIGMSSTLKSCSYTLKMRTGWADNKPIAHDLVSTIQRWCADDNTNISGLSAIMIHGRSRLQRYQKLAKWDYISQVASNQSHDYPKIPIIGNGDIFSYTDYEEKVLKQIKDEDGNDRDDGAVHGISPTAMLARGALIKPWLPTEIKEKRHWDISATERLDMLKKYTSYGLENWGSDQQGVNNTRRFLLEWLSFLHRYVPVGILEHQAIPQKMNQRPPNFMCGRSDLETLMLSKNVNDWIKITELLLGKAPADFHFEPKHKSSGYG